jgi:hypothetical protein
MKGRIEFAEDFDAPSVRYGAGGFRGRHPPVKVLLDTNIVLWAMAGDARLSVAARDEPVTVV